MRDTRRAIRVKCPGLPNVSTYSITAAVRSSCSHHSSRSLVETSARSPTETNSDTPSCRAAACPSSPSPPDCEPIASPPAGTLALVNVVFRLTCPSVFSTPHDSGPTIRNPAPRTISSSRSARPAGAAPSSPAPAGITTSAFAPFAAASAANSSSSSPAAAMITSSGAASSSPTLRAARIEHTTPPAGFTGVTTP